MARLRQNYQKFVERNAELIAVGPEDNAKFAEFWPREKMPFTGIPDPEDKIASLYGQEVNLLKLGRMPALVVIDRQGKIRYQHYGESMSDIPAEDDILALLDELNKERQ